MDNMDKDNEEEWRHIRMPLPWYEVSKRLLLSVFCMTKMVPPKVKVSTSKPASNIGLGILHLLAIYGYRLFETTEEKGNVFREMASHMGGPWMMLWCISSREELEGRHHVHHMLQISCQIP